MLMNGIVNLATTRQRSYIGTFDAGIAILVASGIKQAVARLLHVALWVPITVLGAYYMTREGIKWSDSLGVEANENSQAEGDPQPLEETK